MGHVNLSVNVIISAIILLAVKPPYHHCSDSSSRWMWFHKNIGTLM